MPLQHVILKILNKEINKQEIEHIEGFTLDMIFLIDLNPTCVKFQIQDFFGVIVWSSPELDIWLLNLKWWLNIQHESIIQHDCIYTVNLLTAIADATFDKQHKEKVASQDDAYLFIYQLGLVLYTV